MSWLWGSGTESKKEISDADDAAAADTSRDANATTAVPEKGRFMSVFSTLGSKLVDMKDHVKTQLEVFKAEEQAAAMRSKDDVQDGNAPWDVLAPKFQDREPLLKEQILNLSHEQHNFLNPPPEEALEGFVFNLDDCAATAMKALKEDENLEKMRWVLVPWKLKEPQFWRNYFAHVFVIKKAVLSDDVIIDQSAIRASSQRLAAATSGVDPHKGTKQPQSDPHNGIEVGNETGEASPSTATQTMDQGLAPAVRSSNVDVSTPKGLQSPSASVATSTPISNPLTALDELDLSNASADFNTSIEVNGQLVSMSELEAQMAAALGDFDDSELDAFSALATEGKTSGSDDDATATATTTAAIGDDDGDAASALERQIAEALGSDVSSSGRSLEDEIAAALAE